jgi:hypothetical protein
MIKKLFPTDRSKQEIMAEISSVQFVTDTTTFDFEAAVLGREFNIILMVKEHAPKRIEAIEKEVAQLEKRLLELGKEAGQLEALVNALK